MPAPAAVAAAAKVVATVVPKDKLLKWILFISILPLFVVIFIIVIIVIIFHIPLGTSDKYDLYVNTVREKNLTYGVNINWQHVMAIDAVLLEQEFDKTDHDHVSGLTMRFVIENREEQDSYCYNTETKLYDPCKVEVITYSQKEFDTVLQELVSGNEIQESQIEEVKKFLTFDLQEIKGEIQKSEELPANWIPDETQFIWPIPGLFRLSSKFGSRLDPLTGKLAYHYGMDIPASEGTAVHAPADGIVSHVETSVKSGLLIRFNNSSYGFRFLHLKRSFVRVGDKVVKDQIIAESGNSGTDTTGAHLHFEVFQGDLPVDPLPFYKAN